jgi:DNA-binding GntR family transcriptional regulator
MISRVTMISMARLVIDTHSPEPSYLQLAALLRARIESGQIGPREALPSITYLTGETGLAVGTVRRAIGVLIEEGLAYTVPGRGTFASPRKG